LSEYTQKPVIAGLTRNLHAVDCEPCSLLLIPQLKFSSENFNHPGCMGEPFVEDERPALGKGVAPPRCRNELIGGAILQRSSIICVNSDKHNVEIFCMKIPGRARNDRA